MEDFRKYATKHLGMNSNALDSYMNITSSYISPTIIEERQLNVAQMDVFSRLMMDRIIFLSGFKRSGQGYFNLYQFSGWLCLCRIWHL